MAEFWRIGLLPKNLILYVGNISGNDQLTRNYNMKLELYKTLQVLGKKVDRNDFTNKLKPEIHSSSDVIKVYPGTQATIEYRGKIFIFPYNDTENEILKELKKELGIDQ